MVNGVVGIVLMALRSHCAALRLVVSAVSMLLSLLAWAQGAERICLLGGTPRASSSMFMSKTRAHFNGEWLAHST